MAKKGSILFNITIQFWIQCEFIIILCVSSLPLSCLALWFSRIHKIKEMQQFNTHSKLCLHIYIYIYIYNLSSFFLDLTKKKFKVKNTSLMFLLITKFCFVFTMILSLFYCVSIYVLSRIAYPWNSLSVQCQFISILCFSTIDVVTFIVVIFQNPLSLCFQF